MPLSFQGFAKGFFDQARVVKAISAAKRRAFSKAGAFVRTRARSSIRKKKGSAPPGQPPHSHQGSLRLIFFAFDTRTESVVVGPVEFRAARGPRLGARLLERGGEATYQDARGRPRGGRWEPRPFMRPALEKELPKFTGLLKGSIGG